MSDRQHHDDVLTRALRAVAEDDEAFAASAGVDARLRAEAHAIARARRRRVYAAAGALAAAALVAAIAFPAWRAGTARPPVVDPAGAPDSFPGAGEVTTEYFPLEYSNVPVTDGQTLRLELPRTVLSSFGLEADSTSGTVLADVIVGQDGLARAVRFVQPATSVKEQSQ